MTSAENDAGDTEPQSIEEQIRTKFLSLLTEWSGLDETVAANIRSLFGTELPSQPNLIVDAIKLSESPEGESESDEAE